MTTKTKFEDRLNAILSSEASTEELLESLDSEDQIQRTLPVVTYDSVKTDIIKTEGVTQDMIDDYEFSRSILRGLINRGTSVLEGAMIVAAETENTRAYDTAATIMKSIAEMTKDLMSMHTAVKPKAGTTKIDKQVNIQQNINQDNISDAKDINNLLDSLDD